MPPLVRPRLRAAVGRCRRSCAWPSALRARGRGSRSTTWRHGDRTRREQENGRTPSRFRSSRASGRWRRWRRTRGGNAGDFGPTRCATRFIRVAPRSLPSSSRRRKASTARDLAERAKAIRGVAGKLRALWRPETEDDLEVLMRPEGFAMRAGPRPRLQANLLPLHGEALTAGFVVEFEYRAPHGWRHKPAAGRAVRGSLRQPRVSRRARTPPSPPASDAYRSPSHHATCACVH